MLLPVLDQRLFAPQRYGYGCIQAAQRQHRWRGQTYYYATCEFASIMSSMHLPDFAARGVNALPRQGMCVPGTAISHDMECMRIASFPPGKGEWPMHID
jgi:hypothetical protein